MPAYPRMGLCLLPWIRTLRSALCIVHSTEIVAHMGNAGPSVGLVVFFFPNRLDHKQDAFIYRDSRSSKHVFADARHSAHAHTLHFIIIHSVSQQRHIYAFRCSLRPLHNRASEYIKYGWWKREKKPGTDCVFISVLCSHSVFVSVEKKNLLPCYNRIRLNCVHTADCSNLQSDIRNAFINDGAVVVTSPNSIHIHWSWS